MAQILIFGDSITYGAWDKQGGWAQRLKTLIDTKILDSNFNYYHEVYPLGIPGDTTEDVLRRLIDEMNERLDDDGAENILIFAVGINDSQFLYDTKTHKVAKQNFDENINKLITFAKRYSDKIVFVGLTPVDEQKTDPAPWTPQKSYKNEYVEQYNTAIREQCEKEKIHFINILDVVKNYDYKSLLTDGLHPNTKGHEVIYEQVLKYLTSNQLL